MKWSESDHYTYSRCTGRQRQDWDLSNPATQHMIRVMQDVCGNYVRTHSPEEIAALKRRVEHQRELRRWLFGPPRPVVAWEEQRQWIERFWLSPVLGYELDDPC